MSFHKLYILLTLSISSLLLNCGEGEQGIQPNPNVGGILYDDVTNESLPSPDLDGLSMDAAVADFDNDGDLDIIVANEFGGNILLLNNGEGVFSNESSGRIPVSSRDSEDIGLADFDNDGDIDIVIVSEDDQINELYYNNGTGLFADVSNRIIPRGISNGVGVADFNGDGSPDIFIANNGQNFLLLNRGLGRFDDFTITNLPQVDDVTQDVEVGDVDGDGDLDVLLGNEDRNRLWLNDGNGIFSDVSENAIPLRNDLEETREAIFGDIDGDGDLDIFFANVDAFISGANRQNRLLVNNGSGTFTDASDDLPIDFDQSFTAKFADLDADGDLDIITGNANGAGFGGTTPYRVYENRGDGTFFINTDAFFPTTIGGRGFDINLADFNGDNRLDILFSSRGSADEMLFRKPD